MQQPYFNACMKRGLLCPSTPCHRSLICVQCTESGQWKAQCMAVKRKSRYFFTPGSIFRSSLCNSSSHQKSLYSSGFPKAAATLDQIISPSLSAPLYQELPAVTNSSCFTILVWPFRSLLVCITYPCIKFLLCQKLRLLFLQFEH